MLAGNILPLWKMNGYELVTIALLPVNLFLDLTEGDVIIDSHFSSLQVDLSFLGAFVGQH